jgi:ribosome-binding factor A
MAQDGHHSYPRAARLNQILREVISDQVVRLSDLDDRLGLVTVTGVETSPDVRFAMVFLDSLTPEVKEVLEEYRAQIQSAVNAQTRLKRTPKLTFMADPAIASGSAVEDALRRLSHHDDA